MAIGRNPANVHNVDDLPYFVSPSRAKSPLAPLPMPLGKSTGKIKKQSTPSVIDIKAKISPSDARSFVASWFSASKTVRYVDTVPGSDGETYEFYSNGRAGEAWRPHAGIAGLMSRRGECLVSYVKAPEGARSNILNQCRDINNQLQMLLKQWNAE